MENGRWRMEDGEAWVVNGISWVVAGGPTLVPGRSQCDSFRLSFGRSKRGPDGRDDQPLKPWPIYPPCPSLSREGTRASPYRQTRARTSSKSQRQPPSFSPRKGRPRADRREVIPWRGVESLQHQSSIPVPHRPTLPVPAKAEIPSQIEVRDRPSPERGSGPDRRRSIPRRREQE
jgi:hypothetical protein